MENNYPLEEWDIQLPIDKRKRICFSAMAVAKRKSGKTELLKWLYMNHLYNKYDYKILITTLANAEYYKEFMKGKMDIFYDDEDGKKSTLAGLEAIKRLANKNGERIQKGKNPINTLVILDDTNSRKQKYDDTLLKLYTRGRHVNISIFYCTQSPTLVDSIWRENSDLIFIFKPKQRSFKEYMSENVLNGVIDYDFPSVREEKKTYIRILDTATAEPYRCLVVDYNRDKMFHFKAPI